MLIWLRVNWLKNSEERIFSFGFKGGRFMSWRLSWWAARKLLVFLLKRFRFIWGWKVGGLAAEPCYIFIFHSPSCRNARQKIVLCLQNETGWWFPSVFQNGGVPGFIIYAWLNFSWLDFPDRGFTGRPKTSFTVAGLILLKTFRVQSEGTQTWQ